MTTSFEWLALIILLLGVTMVIYALVWLHGIPHQIAIKNNHPNASAIHVACWLSVFTLHALWPLVYLWAILPRTRLAVDVKKSASNEKELRAKLASLEEEVKKLSNGREV